MHISPELERVVELRRKNIELEAAIAEIEKQLEQNCTLMKIFSPTCYPCMKAGAHAWEKLPLPSIWKGVIVLR